MKNAASGRESGVFLFGSAGSEKMEIRQSHIEGNARNRPALATLIGAMERLPRYQRNEVALYGRKARAAKVPRIRRLTWKAVAEARRLAKETAQGVALIP
jgi:hypothetical protein